MSFAAESAQKYIPIAGTVLPSTLAYHTFRAVPYAHVEDCAQVVRRVLEGEE